MAKREREEEQKKGNFFTRNNNNGIPSLNEQNRFNTPEISDWVHRKDRIRSSWF